MPAPGWTLLKLKGATDMDFRPQLSISYFRYELFFLFTYWYTLKASVTAISIQNVAVVGYWSAMILRWWPLPVQRFPQNICYSAIALCMTVIHNRTQETLCQLLAFLFGDSSNDHKAIVRASAFQSVEEQTHTVLSASAWLSWQCIIGEMRWWHFPEITTITH